MTRIQAGSFLAPRSSGIWFGTTVVLLGVAMAICDGLPVRGPVALRAPRLIRLPRLSRLWWSSRFRECHSDCCPSA
jgi:hypothetical protein